MFVAIVKILSQTVRMVGSVVMAVENIIVRLVIIIPVIVLTIFPSSGFRKVLSGASIVLI